MGDLVGELSAFGRRLRLSLEDHEPLLERWKRRCFAHVEVAKRKGRRGRCRALLGGGDGYSARRRRLSFVKQTSSS
jgi:hypothetical protein